MRAKVLVDADACPRRCLQILSEYQSIYGYRLLTVASFNHNIDNAEHIIVGNEKDAADLAIINRVEGGDLVITQDWGLAALVLAKGAKALAPTGRIFSNDTMDFLLEERALKAKIRRQGGRTKGPAARSSRDELRFQRSLLQLLEAME
ncbi:MAG: DUF188 domain-containing protein [Firmicutes bacterium]|nr:DUF188 domain-containing protein [Bacillota bacterium]